MNRCALLLVVLTLACSSFRTAPAVQESATTGPGIITATELSDPAVAGLSAYDAIQRLRPGYLVDRTAGRTRSSTPIQVSVNGGELNQLNALTAIPIGEVGEIRYLSTSQASTRFGVRASTGPVILVTMRSR